MDEEKDEELEAQDAEAQDFVQAFQWRISLALPYAEDTRRPRYFIYLKIYICSCYISFIICY